MKGKQVLVLLIALILPVALFLFLKQFGKNEFHVQPMFADSLPDIARGCEGDFTLPYAINRDALARDSIIIDSLACVSFYEPPTEDRLARVRDAYSDFPLKFYFPDTEKSEKKACIYLLQEPFDVALVDSKGRIRGQYESSDREEIDRLITEIAIIFKKY